MGEEQDKVRRLHIGGAEVRDGWEIFDVNAAAHVNHVGDAIDLSRFGDCTFTEIYARQVLEHFDYKNDIEVVLGEWLRVLKPQGTLYVSVPDMARLCHLYVTPHLTPDGRSHIMRIMFGGHKDDYDYHLTGLDQEYLAGQLHNAGFVNIRRVPAFNLFRDSSSMEVMGMPISLNMVACRP